MGCNFDTMGCIRVCKLDAKMQLVRDWEAMGCLWLHNVNVLQLRCMMCIGCNVQHDSFAGHIIAVHVMLRSLVSQRHLFLLYATDERISTHSVGSQSV